MRVMLASLFFLVLIPWLGTDVDRWNHHEISYPLRRCDRQRSRGRHSDGPQDFGSLAKSSLQPL